MSRLRDINQGAVMMWGFVLSITISASIVVLTIMALLHLHAIR